MVMGVEAADHLDDPVEGLRFDPTPLSLTESFRKQSVLRGPTWIRSGSPGRRTVIALRDQVRKDLLQPERVGQRHRLVAGVWVSNTPE